MNNKHFIYVLILLVAGCSSPTSDQIKPTSWGGNLVLSPTVNLPLKFELNLNKTDTSITIINGSERLKYRINKTINDSLLVNLKPYNSQLVFKLKKGQINGLWKNFGKGTNYKIEFRAHLSPKPTLKKLEGKENTFQRFKVQFGDDEDGYPAILLLNKEGDELKGTIKTETGDYRFLWGKQFEDSLVLACFDGAHAFLFTALEKNNQLKQGMFYSGNHYKEKWSAQLNDTFKLTDPSKLTRSVSTEKFRFNLLDSNRKKITQGALIKDKPTLIQIMGTWCPNCKDETEYLNKLVKEYTTDKIQVIAAAFEYEKDTTEAFKRIEYYKKAMQMGYPIYYGGSTDKERVTNAFPMLDKVYSYPTLIFLNKKGRVVEIHSGFNGPATDDYPQFILRTNQLIESLIKE